MSVTNLADPAPRVERALDALGNPVRRTILRILSTGPRPVGRIARELPVSRPAVSKHLRILEGAALVSHAREGNRHVFRLEPTGFDATRGWLAAFWDEALPRFARLAEGHDGGSPR
ncbi:MAG TPA: metalloregulator ArsR/SmtB family transcription factor [Sandaracinaceae bacterium LLY-WYZ-13_1]|nr:metalloregulator ArsR/SmtB family transcription factor [Sandaracinaceae bacterium LLY-WYZ-13_1]